MTTRTARPGFSLVEVIIAMLILSVGVLAMGASTGFVMNQIQASQLRSERTAAVRQTTEILGGTAWGSLESVCTNADANTFVTGNYNVRCEVSATGNLKRVRLITSGPSFVAGRFQPVHVDTFVVSLAQPVP